MTGTVTIALIFIIVMILNIFHQLKKVIQASDLNQLQQFVAVTQFLATLPVWILVLLCILQTFLNINWWFWWGALLICWHLTYIGITAIVFKVAIVTKGSFSPVTNGLAVRRGIGRIVGALLMLIPIYALY
ncbi:hypothetical protein QUF58_06035 [Anaerolineales bacterium HSG24]|nr:hypothetical protein [Anaerolineales bacterium HSG24]